jgi:hypothetical protein
MAGPQPQAECLARAEGFSVNAQWHGSVVRLAYRNRDSSDGHVFDWRIQRGASEPVAFIGFNLLKRQ